MYCHFSPIKFPYLHAKNQRICSCSFFRITVKYIHIQTYIHTGAILYDHPLWGSKIKFRECQKFHDQGFLDINFNNHWSCAYKTIFNERYLKIQCFFTHDQGFSNINI